MADFSIGGSFNKSLFNKESYAAAIGKDDKNGYAVVKITPKYARVGNDSKDPPIKGVYNTAEGDLSFTIDSTWAELGGVAQSVLPGGAGGGIIDAYQRVGGVANLLGATAQANVYASKKIYQKSNYMNLKIPMMVVDWDGMGQPIFSALLLAWYCLPSGNVTQDITKAAKDFIDSQVQKMKDSGATGEMITNFLQGTANYFEGAVIKGKDAASKGIDELVDKTNTEYSKDNIIGDADDIITLRSSPVPVKVEIGRFFKHDDMVIENLEYTFSKEMTQAGPLYVKFNISLSTRKILGSIQDIGLGTISNTRYLELVGAGNLT